MTTRDNTHVEFNLTVYLNMYKVVLLGASGVGKTTIVEHYQRGQYIRDEPPTIGAAYSSFNVHGRTVQLWDTAGQERYQSLSRMYCRGANAIIGVYDLTNLDSQNLLYKMLKDNNVPGNQPLIIIVGNKKDRTEEKTCFDTEKLHDVGFKHLVHITISAFNSDNVQRVFETIIKDIPLSPNNNLFVDKPLQLGIVSKSWRKCC